MSLTADMKADFLAICEEIPTTVDLVYQSKVKALVREGSLSAELSVGGFDDRRSITAKVLAEDVTTKVKVGDPLDFNGVTYRILSITTRPPLPFLILECEEK